MKHSEPLKLDIERYFTGESDSKESAGLENHFQECTVCYEYLQVLRRERNEFLADHPFIEFRKSKLPDALSSPWYRNVFDLLAKPALLPVYGLLLIVTISVPVILNKDDDRIRFKGAAPLGFIYQRDGAVHEGDRKKTYRAGDRIQVRYHSSREQFVSLLSIDSKGQVSFYHPEQSSGLCSVKSPAGSGLAFPGSIILDDTEGCELIIVLFSGKPLHTETVSGWISGQYEKHQTVSELERVILKEKPGSVSAVSTLLLHKE